MSENYEAPSPYAAGIAQLRELAAKPAIHPKETADRAARHLAAIEFSAEQIVRLELEQESVERFDAAAKKAAEELGVDVRQLRIASDADDLTYPPPSCYGPALRALKEAK
jgi:hypothetical protein